MAEKLGIVNSNRLNIRSEPSTQGTLVGQLELGDQVTVLAAVGEWFQIESGKGAGYVHGDYLDVAAEGEANAVAVELPGFRGDVAWIHRWEGHAGKPYWPGGASGVTLDPGLDLGHAKPQLIAQAFQSRLMAPQFEAVRKALGVQGEIAKNHLAADRVLQSIRVDRKTASEIFPLIARPYWRSLRKRFPGLDGAAVPCEVHTATLSLAYNRGAGNRGLEVLKDPIAQGAWKDVGEHIAAMQQDHALPGIRRRRRAEGELIIAALT